MRDILNDDLILNELESLDFINKIKNPSIESAKKMNAFLNEDLFEIVKESDGRIFLEIPNIDFTYKELGNKTRVKSSIKFESNYKKPDINICNLQLDKSIYESEKHNAQNYGERLELNELKLNNFNMNILVAA